LAEEGPVAAKEGQQAYYNKVGADWYNNDRKQQMSWIRTNSAEVNTALGK